MPTRCVLVLEDDDTIRGALVEVLERAGYRAEGARNGAEGLARLPDLQPDVILLDMVMPVMDGFEFLARLRADSRWSSVPLIITSELGEQLKSAVDARGTQVLRIAGFVPKPFKVAAIVAHVRDAVGPPEVP